MNNSSITQVDLVPCPACQQQVSTQAVSCPHCGHPLQVVMPNDHDVQASRGMAKSVASAVLLVIGVLVIAFGLWDLSTSNRGTESAKDRIAQMKMEYGMNGNNVVDTATANPRMNYSDRIAGFSIMN